MNTKHGFRLIAGAIVATACLAGAAAAVAQTKIINIGTAAVGTSFHAPIALSCKLLDATRATEGHNFRCVAEATAGSVGNLRAIRLGDLDLGMAQSDWQYHAYHGKGPFEKDGPNPDLRFVMSFTTNMTQTVARKDSGIKHFRELKGKRLNTGNTGSGSEAMWTLLAPYFGIHPKNDLAAESKLTAREQGPALCDNKYDAFFYPTAAGEGVMREVADTCDVVFVPIDGPEVDKIFKDHPYYGRTFIPGGTYRGNPNDVAAVGYAGTLVATKNVPEEFAYRFVKAVFDNFEDFKKQSALFKNMSRESSYQFGKSVPYHPGAERYYREVGLLK